MKICLQIIHYLHMTENGASSGAGNQLMVGNWLGLQDDLLAGTIRVRVADRMMFSRFRFGQHVPPAAIIKL